MNKIRFIIGKRLYYTELLNRFLFQRKSHIQVKTIFFRSLTYKNVKYTQRNIKSSTILAAILSFFGIKEEFQETPEHLMGLAIMAIEDDKLNEALDFLHQILKMLSDKFENNEITKTEYEGKRARIFSEMGNVYMLQRELDTASKLIIETIRSCFLADIQPSNPIIIELSLKLALIYEEQEKFEDSDLGFRFCIDNCLIESERRDIEEDEKENVCALLGMCYNYYSKFLYKTSKYTSAIVMASKSLEHAIQIYEKNHPNIVNLINDQAVIYLALKDFKSATTKFQEAINICLEYPRDELMSILPLIYANIGQLYIKVGDIEKAEEMCLNSQKYWQSNYQKKDIPNIELETQVLDCFSQLAGLRSAQRED